MSVRRRRAGATASGARLLSIGEVGRMTGIDPRTIRFYEAAGVLPAPLRLPNGYRAYRPEDVRRLRFVASARRLGFTLPEIAEILAIRDRGEAPCAQVLEAALTRLREVTARIEELRRLESELKGLVEAARRLPAREPGAGPCVCRLVERLRKPSAAPEDFRAAPPDAPASPAPDAAGEARATRKGAEEPLDGACIK